MGAPRGILGDPGGALWGSLGSLGIPGGVPGAPQKRRWFFGGVLGWSCEALGVFLEVLGGPVTSLGESWEIRMLLLFVLAMILEIHVFSQVRFQ